MKINSVSFDTPISIDSHSVSIFNKKQIVFLGRSNVGKSTLLNTLFQSKSLVKTSQLPGKTKTANLFLVNHKYHFVDMPGYGFAKLGQEQRQKLDSLISWYLEEFRLDIRKMVIILDAKIGPTQSDLDMFEYLQSLSIPAIFLLNKIDKLSNNEVTKSLVHTQGLLPTQYILPTSSVTKVGMDVLMREISESLK